MLFLSLFLFFLSIHTVLAQNETSSLIDSLCEDQCIFAPTSLTSGNYKQWPRKCSTVCAEVNIGPDTDLTEDQLTATFKNLKKLVGSLAVTRTKYKNMRFLAGLENLECDDSYFMCLLNPKMTEIGMLNLTSISCRIYIASNVKMSRLNTPNLKNFEPTDINHTLVDININSMAADFCVTIDEMSNFLGDKDVNVGYLPGGYCEVSTGSNETEKVCGIDNSTLSELEYGCVHIRGDVVVESGDEEHVEKLETVRSIFGALVINGTNLTDVDFLSDLQYVASLKRNEAAIQVRFNPGLSNVTFPSLKRVRSDTRFSIVFNNNSKELLMDPNICFGIRTTLNLTDDSAPTIDGQSCEHIRAEAIVRDGLSGTSSSLLTSCSIVAVVTYFTILIFSQ